MSRRSTQRCGYVRGKKKIYWQSDRKRRGLPERSNFVNLVEGAGLYGFDGIRKVAGLMIEAWQEVKRSGRSDHPERFGGAKAAYETKL